MAWCHRACLTIAVSPSLSLYCSMDLLKEHSNSWEATWYEFNLSLTNASILLNLHATTILDFYPRSLVIYFDQTNLRQQIVTFAFVCLVSNYWCPWWLLSCASLQTTASMVWWDDCEHDMMGQLWEQCNAITMSMMWRDDCEHDMMSMGMTRQLQAQCNEHRHNMMTASMGTTWWPRAWCDTTTTSTMQCDYHNHNSMQGLQAQPRLWAWHGAHMCINHSRRMSIAVAILLY
jgi:hypothetical protein